MSDNEFHCFDPALLCRPDDYTGNWEAFWPNGNLKYRSRLVDGVEVGQQVCYWEDGTIARISWHDSLGRPRGTTVSFHPEGDKDEEEVWNDIDPQPGSFVRRCYDANGDVFLRTTYRDFEQIDCWERPYDPTEEDIETDKLIDEAVKHAVHDLMRKLDLDYDEPHED